MTDAETIIILPEYLMVEAVTDVERAAVARSKPGKRPEDGH